MSYDDGQGRGLDRKILEETLEVERHLHGERYAWGATGAPTETNAIAKTVTVPFVAISGNDDWGVAIPICGTADNPVGAADDFFDPEKLLVVDTDHATPYLFRFIWGTGTSAAAISAGQVSETMFITAGGPFSSGTPVAVGMVRVAVGAKLWVSIWNATNLSEVDFFWIGHGYTA